MTAAQAKDFLVTFDEHWDDYRKQFKAARQHLSEESVHDLRVAARRFLALIAILGSLDDHLHGRKLRSFLERQLDQLDDLHDAQVLAQETAQRMQSIPMLGMFNAHLEKHAASLSGKARKHVRASRPADLRKQVERIRTMAERHAEDPRLLQQLMQAVDVAHADTVRAFSLMDPRDPATIHDVRIAFKTLRYMIETVRPLLKDYPQDRLQRMHKYQERMGKIHDTVVLLEALKDFESKAPPPAEVGAEAFDAQPINKAYRQQLTELIRAFLAHQDEFEEFWRATPDQPLPWESRHEPLHRSARDRRTAASQRQPGRQPASPDGPGAPEVPQGSTRAEADGHPDRPDPDFPVPAGS